MTPPNGASGTRTVSFARAVSNWSWVATLHLRARILLSGAPAHKPHHSGKRQADFAKEEDGELETRRRRAVPAAGRRDGAGDARRIRVPGAGNGAQEEPGQCAGEDPGRFRGLDRGLLLRRVPGGVWHELLRR